MCIKIMHGSSRSSDGKVVILGNSSMIVTPDERLKNIKIMIFSNGVFLLKQILN
jgi:hypothetical protein